MTDISRDVANSQFRHVHVYQKIVRVEVRRFRDYCNNIYLILFKF